MLPVTTQQSDPAVGRVALPGGLVALVDAADLALVEKYVWLVHHRSGTTPHAFGYLRGHAGRGRTNVAMHRLLLDPPAHLDVDHRNRNGLDNRRCNLRVATRSQNNANSWSPRNKSGYKGVRQHRDGVRWAGHIQVNGQSRYLGLFPTAVAAALAYNAAAIEAWGEFALLNEVP